MCAACLSLSSLERISVHPLTVLFPLLLNLLKHTDQPFMMSQGASTINTRQVKIENSSTIRTECLRFCPDFAVKIYQNLHEDGRTKGLVTCNIGTSTSVECVWEKRVSRVQSYPLRLPPHPSHTPNLYLHSVVLGTVSSITARFSNSALWWVHWPPNLGWEEGVCNYVCVCVWACVRMCISIWLLFTWLSSHSPFKQRSVFPSLHC